MKHVVKSYMSIKQQFKAQTHDHEFKWSVTIHKILIIAENKYCLHAR